MTDKAKTEHEHAHKAKTEVDVEVEEPAASEDGSPKRSWTRGSDPEAAAAAVRAANMGSTGSSGYATLPE
jgi:hypothetical protein